MPRDELEPRPRRSFSIQVRPIDWALIHYYAAKQGKHRRDVVRRVMSIYANADRSFDHRDFINFARTELLRDESEREARDQLLKQVVAYAQDRHLADEPTATLAEGPRPHKLRDG